jgi:hypothetical protein
MKADLLCPSQGDRLDHGRQRRASQKLSLKLLEIQTQTSEELMEEKNTVVLLVKTTTVTRLTVGWCEGVELTPHLSQLAVEGVNGGVLLSNGASKLQDVDVESVTLWLVELRRMVPHHSSGRQGGEIHSELDLHTTKEDLSSMSLSSSPILVVTQVEHVLLTGRSIVCLCLIKRRSTIRPDSRLGRMNRDRRVRSVASEMSPKPLTVKAHTKYRGHSGAEQGRKDEVRP